MIGRRTSARGFTFADGMTPMIDVVFLLMIFFLAVARLSEARLIRRELPASASEAPIALEREPEAVVINVRADGVLVVGGREVDAASGDAAVVGGGELDRVGTPEGAGVVWVRADRLVDAVAVVAATGAAEEALGSRGGGVVRFTSTEGGR